MVLKLNETDLRKEHPVNELQPEHGAPLAWIVNDASLLSRVDVSTVGPERDQALAWGDSFDVYPNPFTGADELMSGHDYERIILRYGRFFSRRSLEELPTELPTR